MSIPDTKLDLPGDPWCGTCGLCHQVGDPGYGCMHEDPDLELLADLAEDTADAIEAAELRTQER